MQILAIGEPMHEGIGGKSALISIEGTLVFVKKVPLTDLERLPQHVMSTANIFDLPMSCQYGVGSPGFGAWRELATHKMTTNWVITGECANFPMLYHWRILTCEPGDMNISHWGDIEGYCQYWENNSALRKRVEALTQASVYVALCLEYVPHNVQTWLSAQMLQGGDRADAAVTFVEKQLKATNRHINMQGLMHFDAHFENILTDGEQLYLSDFGSALSSEFDLSTAETEFFKRHQSYDQACAAVNMLHCIITSLFGKDKWEVRLAEYLAGELGQVAPAIDEVIQRYAPMALIMDDFFQKLQKESKSTPYPAARIEQLLKRYTLKTT